MLSLQKERPLFQQIFQEKKAKKQVLVLLTSMPVTANRKKAIENAYTDKNNENSENSKNSKNGKKGKNSETNFIQILYI